MLLALRRMLSRAATLHHHVPPANVEQLQLQMLVMEWMRNLLLTVRLQAQRRHRCYHPSRPSACNVALRQPRLLHRAKT